MRKPSILALLGSTSLVACGLGVTGLEPPPGALTDAGPLVDTGGAAADATTDAPVTPGGDAEPGPSDAAADAPFDAPVDAPADAPSDSVDANPCSTCTGVAHRICVNGTTCLDGFRVFLSSSASNADLDGPDGANLRCQKLANEASLGGTWQAWLSTGSASHPAKRFTQAIIPYRLLDGTLVAKNFADLTGNLDQPGGIRAAIHLTENLVDPGNVEVWTGTAPDGTPSAYARCDGFNSNDNSVSKTSMVGWSQYKDQSWTSRYDQYCDRTNPHLYCFEQ